MKPICPVSVKLLTPVVAGVASVVFVAAAEFKFPTQTLTVPDGFEVERVAGPPLVDRPVTADFDEHGRLYVTDSSGSNDKPDKQLQERPHRVVRLEDTDGDGRFDQSVVFADRMMFPEGCLWYDGSVYVAAPPSIWKLTDTDGDGVADRREEWFQGKTLTGCANDLHGPFLGLDGWIYWCKGAFAEQTYERPGRPPLQTRAAHIFRARPDGRDLEPVLTGGMDNPVSVAFTPGGERILTGTFFQHPGGGKRDGLIHAIYGGVYGKDHDVLDGHKRTGDLMPIMTHHGPAASCWVIRYRGRAFGAEYQDNLLACLFNLHKVTRHVLEPAGATFRTRDSDFLVSDNPDFHPTQVLEDADGSLLVVDTGGWYKICCPTSQLWKPDVLGAIYRVRKKGAPKLDDPRGLTLAWAKMNPRELADRLGDPRPAVQDRARHELAKRGSQATPALAKALKDPTSVDKRRNAVWALTRLDGAAARAAVRSALSDADESVRLAALHSISLWRDRDAVEPLLKVLETGTPPLQRAAAEALGRLGDPRAVPPLLAAAGAKPDRILEHSLIYALIEIDDPGAVRRALDPRRSRAALIALDQMDGGDLRPDEVAPLLSADDAVLKETASWIVGHRPEWGTALAGFFRRRLREADLGDAEANELQRHLARLANSTAIQALLAEAMRGEGFEKAARLAALRAAAQANLQQAPASWTAGLVSAIGHPDAQVRDQAVATARALAIAPTAAGELTPALLRVARDSGVPAKTRLDALAAVPGGLDAVDSAMFEFLLTSVAPSNAVPVRSSAARVLAKARLTEAQLAALAERLKSVGPMEIGPLLGAFDASRDESLGLKLIDALQAAPAVAGLHPDLVRPHFTNFPPAVQVRANELIASLNANAAQQQAHLETLLASLKGGDVRRGQAVFNSEKAACASCHAIGYLGGDIGPDLTRIGQIRTERDLLEAVVYPSASFVRSYEPVIVVTRSGDDYSGVLRKDAPDEVVLATGPGTEVRVARADIVEMRPGTVSVMPQGLDQQLTTQELADLIAFLKATRW